jgi:hypothetical protein
MNRLLMLGVLLAGLGAVARAEEGRFHVFQGYVPAGAVGEAPKGGSQTAVVLKVDAETGDTWRLVISGGNYWWLPIKNGVIPGKKAQTEEKMEEEAPGDPKAN